MKVKGKLVLDFSIILAVMAVLVASAGCFYPKAERVSGELVSDVLYKIDHETNFFNNVRLTYLIHDH